jgi:hypothetical protein
LIFDNFFLVKNTCHHTNHFPKWVFSGLWRWKGRNKKQITKILTYFCRQQQIIAVLKLLLSHRERKLKGVWWMPRLYKAMKDAAWRRNASGRCQATFDPEMSE